MTIAFPHRQKPARGGFTLTELAIVLLGFGLVTAAIWTVSGKVWTNYGVAHVTQQVATMAQNVRDYYTAIQSFTQINEFNGTDITQIILDQASNGDVTGLFPQEMRRTPSAAPGKSSIDHALNNNYANGSFHVLVEHNPNSPASAGQDAFRFEIQGLGQTACIKLLMAEPVIDSELGVVRIGTKLKAVNVTTANINNGTLPIVASTAQSWCRLTNDTNEVDIDFALHN